MRKREGLQLCYCAYYGCKGKPVSAEDWLLHNQLSEAVQLEALESEVARIALIDVQPLGKQATTSPSFCHTGLVQPLSAPTDEAHIHQPPSLPSQTSKAKEIYRELFRLDKTMHEHLQSTTQVLEQWSHGNKFASSFKSTSRFLTRREAQQFLLVEASWLQDNKARVKSVKLYDDAANALLRKSMVERADVVLTAISSTLESWAREEESMVHSPDFYSTEKFFSHPLRTANAGIVAALFMAIVLNLLGNAARLPCNFILRMMKVVLGVLLRDPNDIKLLDKLPTDIRTARKQFDLDPSITIFASCPTCCFAHSPMKRSGSSVDTYPARCSFKRYPGSQPCGARLTKFGVKDQESVRVPIKPYPIQSFRAFVGGLYCRAGIEEAIVRTTELISEGEDIWDITEANAIQNLPGPDGNRFLDCKGEIRTVWSLSYDGFNPLSNKAAGKATSVGSLAMMCLSLPPSIRYRSENIYLNIIPGPRQPTLDALNPFLSPLIDILDECYHRGTWYSRTIQCPEGRRSREAVVPLVADLPGSRKVSGCAGHSATRFCSICYLKQEDINNTEFSTWRHVTYAEHLEAAKAWRDAPNKSKRKQLYKANGVRWSELLRLSYWDPTRYVVVDGMHNLFLGLVRHHFREIIGTQWKEPAVDKEFQDKQVSEKEINKGRRIFQASPNKAKLQRLTIPVLRILCIEYNILDRVPQDGECTKKKQYIEALLSRTPSISRPSSVRLEGDLSLIDADPVADIEGTAFIGYRPMLDTKDLLQIQADIASTIRPTWRTSPPKNFGMPMQGKHKVDEWKACIEFDLPVSLVKLWMCPDDGSSVENPENTQRWKAIKSTMGLAAAIRWATSYRTSKKHAEKCRFYMASYVWGLHELRPHMDLHPIHHNALHLPDFLPEFGPMHGWWMFAFERLIGTLQNINTNFHFGQLEVTMLKTFCAAAELKASLQRPGCPKILQQSIPILQDCFPDLKEGTLMHDIQAMGTPSHNKTASEKTTTLQGDVQQLFGQLAGYHLSNFIEYTRYSIRGNEFAPRHTSLRNSTIFYQPQHTTLLVPAVIRQIFSPSDNVDLVFLAVHRHSPASWQPNEQDPFAEFPDFGASIWAKGVQDQVEIIQSTERIHAAEFRRWGLDKMVMKPIIEVRRMSYSELGIIKVDSIGLLDTISKSNRCGWAYLNCSLKRRLSKFVSKGL